MEVLGLSGMETATERETEREGWAGLRLAVIGPGSASV